MFCKKCGNPVGDGLEKCPFCGEPLGKVPSGENKTDDGKVEKTEGNHTDEDAKKQDSENETIGAEQSLSAPEKTGQEISESETPKFSPVSISPEKHKIKHKKAVIITACAVALIAIAGITAKTYFARDIMRTFMGNGKYLQSSENSAVNVMLDKSVGGLDDIKTVSLRQTNMAYSSEASMNIKLDGAAKNQLGTQYDKILNFVNAISFKSDNYSDGKAAKSDFCILHKSNKLLSGSYYFKEDGSQIFQLPEISNTYLVNGSAAKFNSLNLQYDSGKLKASLQKLAEIYTDEIPSGKASIQKDQTLTVKGVSVNAEKVSVTLSGRQLKDISKKMFETIKNDDYIYTFVSENYNLFSFSPSADKMSKAPTKKEFQSKCDAELKKIDSNKSAEADTLTVSAYIKPDNTQVARSYESTDSSTGNKSSLTIIFTNEAGTHKYAFNTKTNGKNDMSGIASCNSAGSGTAEISFCDSGSSEENNINMNFSNVKKESFAGGEALTGTYGITFDFPSIGSNYSNPFHGLSDLSIKATTSISGGTENTKIAVDIKNAANISFKVTNTPIAQKKITAPKIQKGNTIFLNGGTESNYELQNKYGESVSKYVMSLPGKDRDLADIMMPFLYGRTASGSGIVH